MVEGNSTRLTDHFQTLNWLLNQLNSTKQKFLKLSAETQKVNHIESQSYKYLASYSEAAQLKCEKYYKKADKSAAYYTAIVLNPTLKMLQFKQQWEDKAQKDKQLTTVKALVKELQLEYKGNYISTSSNLSKRASPESQSKKIYTSI